MPRLMDTARGVVVNVDDATAAQLGAEYKPIAEQAEPEPAPEVEPEKKAAPRRSTRKQ